MCCTIVKREISHRLMRNTSAGEKEELEVVPIMVYKVWEMGDEKRTWEHFRA